MSKLGKGDRVVVGCDFSLGDTYGNETMRCEEGRTHTIRGVTSSGKLILEGFSYVWDKAWLTKVDVKLTKATWIEGLVAHGELGIQSGNSDQRWKYNADRGLFQVQSYAGKEWRDRDMNDLCINRAFSFQVDTEMTIADIEKALGVTNLKVIK